MALLVRTQILFGFLICSLTVISLTKGIKLSFRQLGKKKTFSAKPFIPAQAPPPARVFVHTAPPPTTQEITTTQEPYQQRRSQQEAFQGIVFSNPSQEYISEPNIDTQSQASAGTLSSPGVAVKRTRTKSVSAPSPAYHLSNAPTDARTSYVQDNEGRRGYLPGSGQQQSSATMIGQLRNQPQEYRSNTQYDSQVSNQPQDVRASTQYDSQLIKQPQNSRSSSQFDQRAGVGRQEYQQTPIKERPYSTLQISPDVQGSNIRNQYNDRGQSPRDQSRPGDSFGQQPRQADYQTVQRDSFGSQSDPQLGQFQEQYPYKKEPLGRRNSLTKPQNEIPLNHQNAHEVTQGGKYGLSVSFKQLKQPTYEFQPPASAIMVKQPDPPPVVATVAPVRQHVPAPPPLVQLQPPPRNAKIIRQRYDTKRGQGQRQQNQGRFYDQGQGQRPARQDRYYDQSPQYKEYRAQPFERQASPRQQQRRRQSLARPPMGRDRRARGNGRNQMRYQSGQGPEPRTRSSTFVAGQGPLTSADYPGKRCQHTAECPRGCCYTDNGEILDLDTYGPNGPRAGTGQGRCTSREPGLQERCDDLCTCQRGLQCYRRYKPNYKMGEKMARNPRFEPPEMVTRPPRKCVRKAVSMAERFVFWKCYFDSWCSGPLPK